MKRTRNTMHHPQQPCAGVVLCRSALCALTVSFLAVACIPAESEAYVAGLDAAAPVNAADKNSGNDGGSDDNDAQGGGKSNQVDGDDDGGDGGGELEACELGALVPARVRRLSAQEFRATIRSVVGEDISSALSFPTDPISNGYENKAEQLRVTSSLAQVLWVDIPEVAFQAAQSAVQASDCAQESAPDASCAEQLLSSFASKAYRKPIEAAALADLVTVFEVGSEGATFEDGITEALRVVFQSAEFLYHTELGSAEADSEGSINLNASEIAEQLSYLVTGAPPDAPLQKLAEGDALYTAESRASQMRRLLELPAAAVGIGTFGAQWLEVSQLGRASRDVASYPSWPEHWPRAIAEAEAFFSSAVLSSNADFAELLTADWSIGDAALAEFYGATLDDGRLALPKERRGVLTQSAFLAAQSQAVEGSPIQRGHFIRVRLFCQEIPPPPPNLVITLPAPDPDKSSRERFADHSSDPSCAGCHRLMDPIGYAFSNFNAIGGFSTTENGRDIDATGSLVGTDVDAEFNGAVELGRQLAGSQQARECFAGNWLEFVSALTVEPDSRCDLAPVGADFISGDASVKELMIELASSDLFLTRAPQLK